ncbi:MAG: hypothetical protein CMF74_16960 [Maricaulis sp.]|jgi:hypothetical protein|nr:hypothetical protein [Maricaulis sp.]HAQ35766.1 hypothetical protein [Alphaproteobacteria bacterium]
MSLIAAILVLAQAGHPVTAGSAWENQSGSVLHIDEVRENGHFHGRYVNNAEGYPCSGVEYRVVGDVFDPLIQFSVVWRSEEETCHSVTGWTGQIEGGRLVTEWRLVRWRDGTVSDFTGESVFERRADGHAE